MFWSDFVTIHFSALSVDKFKCFILGEENEPICTRYENWGSRFAWAIVHLSSHCNWIKRIPSSSSFWWLGCHLWPVVWLRISGPFSCWVVWKEWASTSTTRVRLNVISAFKNIAFKWMRKGLLFTAFLLIVTNERPQTSHTIEVSNRTFSAYLNIFLLFGQI